MGRREPNDELSPLIDEFERIRNDMLRLVEESADLLQDVHSHHQPSARNLLHYLALRSHDLRPLQARLTAVGLSSLGRAESHVLAAVESVLQVLERLSGEAARFGFCRVRTRRPCGGSAAARCTHRGGARSRPTARGVAIMVTMPSEAADDYTLVSRLLQEGMDCMRINCAHDGPDQWARMIEHLRRAEDRHHRSCRILMDLAGPKVRTGELELGPAVVKFRPAARRLWPRHRAGARVAVCGRAAPPIAHAGRRVAAGTGRLAAGAGTRRHDPVRRRDVARPARFALWLSARRAAGSSRTRPATSSPGRCFVSSAATRRMTTRRCSRPTVGALPAREVPLTLVVGDELIVTRSTIAGRNAVRDERGHVLTPATIGCTADQVFEDVRAGDHIWFDDGKIGGVVERRECDRLHVRITRASARGARLRNEKGINLPDTELRLPAITDKDRADLDFVCQHADMVALSFVNSVEDVRELRSVLEPLGEAQPAIVLKIETRRGFENLPAMLLEAMKSPRCAVMIARGDLAVECGFERMAEVQEEILWVCEAAHVPGDLGDTGARDAGEGRHAFAGRGDRRGDGESCRVRHAEQGPVHPSGGPGAR